MIRRNLLGFVVWPDPAAKQALNDESGFEAAALAVLGSALAEDYELRILAGAVAAGGCHEWCKLAGREAHT